MGLGAVRHEVEAAFAARYFGVQGQVQPPPEVAIQQLSGHRLRMLETVEQEALW